MPLAAPGSRRPVGRSGKRLIQDGLARCIHLWGGAFIIWGRLSPGRNRMAARPFIPLASAILRRPNGP